MSTLEAAGVRLAAEVGLTDVLAAAPNPEAGLSIAEIAAKVGVNSTKLGMYIIRRSSLSI
jgi:hypothetical protein